jgi:aminopeptidase-like protein
MAFDELSPHIYTLPEQPDVIPYVTSYYRERWGFCLSHHEFEKLPREGMYRARIDAKLNPAGSLTFGHAVLPGRTKKEIVLSINVCHPSLAHNELSGILTSIFLYQKLNQLQDRYYTYRFIFTPETIGTITYLHKFGDYLRENVYAGLVLTCTGDAGKFTYKKSKKDDSEINKMSVHILKHYAKNKHRVVEFIPMGGDERQYNSPGFNLSFGSLMRTVYGEYKEYHTSADNKDFISFTALAESIEMYFKVCKGFEMNRRYTNLLPYGEPFLTQYGLYPDINIAAGKKEQWIKQLLVILNYSDGETPLLDIAEKLEVPILDLEENVQALLEKKIIKY